eukprot:jgi/Undpi1/2980/HiC_scaffold_14.g06357.m1
MSVSSESAPLDGRFRDVGITTEEGRVLRDLGKLYIRLQDVLGAGSSMTTRDQGKAVSSLVAAKTATLRTSRLPASKINVPLEPVLSVIKLLRPRTGASIMTETQRAYLLGVLRKRADEMEEAISQAQWTRNWPVVPAELAFIDNRLMRTTSTTAAYTSGIYGVRCGKASATIDPRATHLRGSGAVVAS